MGYSRTKKEKSVRIALPLTGTMVIACLSAGCTAPGDESPAAIDTTSGEPSVVMEADPPPPFIYWAPEESTICNLSRTEGIWVAEKAGEPDTLYYGDECLASNYQQFVGAPIDILPEKPAGAEWRKACTTCSVTDDFRGMRMNIFYDEIRA